MTETSPAFAIAGRAIGPDHPPYLIAELSGNHNGDIGRALALIDAAAEAGADAAKIQTYTPDTITLRSDRPEFTISGGPWAGRTLHDLYAEAHTPYEWHPRLFERARERGITLFSSPFDDTAVDLLAGLGAPAYKIASFELVDLPLIRRVAATGKPMLISTGMATLAEMDEAVATARAAGALEIALLHCASAYPASPDDMNLRTIPHLAEAFALPVGLSDHTLGIAAPVAAVALGAVMIEKHLTLTRDNPSADSSFSAEPHEFRLMADEVRAAERSLGTVAYDRSPAEKQNRRFRRSLFVVEDIREGERFTAVNVRSIRPSAGLHTRHLGDILGRRAARDIPRGTPLSWDLIH